MGNIETAVTRWHRFAEQSSTPATPAAGHGIIYIKSDGRLYIKNDAGTESEAGGGLGVAQTAPTELTIASGAITVTQGFHKIDTEADAGTDDLDTINGLVTNAKYLFRAENAGRTVVFKHGTGNIKSPTLSDVWLTDVTVGVEGWYDGTNFNLLTPSKINDADDWGSWPDNTVNIGAQDTTDELYRIRGDYMRLWAMYPTTSSYSTDMTSMMYVRFDDATDRTVTINSSSIVEGHSIRSRAEAVSGGTGHSILLPSGVTWDGTNRRVILNATSDRLFAVAESTTRFFLWDSTGCTFAAS